LVESWYDGTSFENKGSNVRESKFTIEYLLNEGIGLTIKRGFIKDEVASFIRSNKLIDCANYIRIYTEDGREAYSYNEETKKLEKE
jgi:hypothetical protein